MKDAGWAVAHGLGLEVRRWPLEVLKGLQMDGAAVVAERPDPEWRRWVIAGPREVPHVLVLFGDEAMHVLGDELKAGCMQALRGGDQEVTESAHVQAEDARALPLVEHQAGVLVQLVCERRSVVDMGSGTIHRPSTDSGRSRSA